MEMAQVSEQAELIGRRLRKARLEQNLSQAELAFELGFSVRALQGYEQGRNLAQPRRRRQLLAWLDKHEAAA